MLINAANKHHLTKNETEYLSNLHDVPDDSTACGEDNGEARPKALIDRACLRKINLLTAKERPFCQVCKALVGFSWKKRKEESEAELPETACLQCFEKEIFTAESREAYEDCSISRDYWSRLEKDLSCQVD